MLRGERRQRQRNGQEFLLADFRKMDLAGNGAFVLLPELAQRTSRLVLEIGMFERVDDNGGLSEQQQSRQQPDIEPHSGRRALALKAHSVHLAHYGRNKNPCRSTI